MLIVVIDTTTVHYTKTSFVPEMRKKCVSFLRYMFSCLETLAYNSLSRVKLVSLLNGTEDKAVIMRGGLYVIGLLCLVQRSEYIYPIITRCPRNNGSRY
jgi:hydrogenase-4 membrane subunit HyfE